MNKWAIGSKNQEGQMDSLLRTRIQCCVSFISLMDSKVQDLVVLKEAGSSKQGDEGYIEREDHLFKLLSLSLLCLIVFHEIK